jgi:hypothetical protein
VIPYYEFSLKKPLTISEWRRRLDSDERPRIPFWLNSIFGPGVPEKSWEEPYEPVQTGAPQATDGS